MGDNFSDDPRQVQDPQEPGDIMGGYEQFEVYRGDFFPEAEDDDVGDPGSDPGADHSGAPDASGDAPQGAAPPEGGTTGDAAGGDAGGGEPSSGQFRHKSHEEAERSYAHLMSRTTRAEQDNARLRRQLQDIEDAKKKQQQDQEAARQRDEFVQQKYEEAARAVDELDPDDPEYHTKTARIWADVHRSVDAFTPAVDSSGGSDIPRASDMVGGQGQQAADAGAASAGDGSDPGGESGTTSPASPPDTAAPAEGDDPGDGGGYTQAEIHQKIDARIGEKTPGFDREDPAFIAFCGRAPTQDEQGRPLSIEDQIDYAIESTRAHYDKKRREMLQASAQPMDRGASNRGASRQSNAQDQQETFGDIVEAAVASHTL